MNRTATTTTATIAEPGRNCWCIERADRFAVLPDGEYYRRFREAALRATHTIFILAWDITGATELIPNLPGDGPPTRLDKFIRYLAKRRPTLKIHILTWDYGVLFTMERDPFSRWHFGWRMPRNVRFGFDDHHPIGGCHHQKVVVSTTRWRSAAAWTSPVIAGTRRRIASTSPRASMRTVRRTSRITRCRR